MKEETIAGKFDHPPHDFMKAMTCENCHLLEIAMQWMRLYKCKEIED